MTLARNLKSKFQKQRQLLKRSKKINKHSQKSLKVVNKLRTTTPATTATRTPATTTTTPATVTKHSHLIRHLNHRPIRRPPPHRNQRPHQQRLRTTKLYRIPPRVVKSRHLRPPHPLLQSRTPSKTEAWPHKFRQMYVISLRKERWDKAASRLQFLPGNLNLWQATDGRKIDKTVWKKTNKLTNIRMRRGQVGCYESHRRIWEHMVKNDIPYATIFEDDVDIRPHHMDVIAKGYEQMEKKDPHWQLLFLSRSKLKRPLKMKVAPNLGIPAESWGCFAYVLSKKGAAQLLKKSLPIRRALDVYVFQQANVMKTYTILPHLFYVVPVKSDTRNIK